MSDGKPAPSDLAHPLAASNLLNLIRLGCAYGCDRKYIRRFLTVASLSALRSPIRWTASALHRRQTRRQTVLPPVFIVGHWRSGTTHLQNLMSCDPQFGRVTLLQAAMPYEFLLLSPSMKQRIGKMLPSKRLMDDVPVSGEIPWEEELALAATGPFSFFHVSFFPAAMDRIVRKAVFFDDGKPDLIERWKRQYESFLRKVQSVQPDKPLLLKNPANSARLHLLGDMYPGARFIHIHRNPYRVYASTVHLYQKAQEAWGLHETDRTAIVEHVLQTYPQVMTSLLDQWGSLKDDQGTMVRFDDLESDPVGTLSRTYEQIGLDGFESALPLFRAYLEGQRSYQKNRLPLTESERSRVASAWQPLFDRLGYET